MNNIEIVKKYFELLNNKDLIGIEKMFTKTSKYNSENTGEFFGVKEIMKMMKEFFNNFEKLNWKNKRK